MKKSWFDSESGVLRLDEMAMESPSFRGVVADGVVTDEELAEQVRHVTGLLGELDARLPPELHALAGRALTELAVLHALQIRHQSQGEV